MNTDSRMPILRRLASRPVPLHELIVDRPAGGYTLSLPDPTKYDDHDAPVNPDVMRPGRVVAVRAFGQWRHGVVTKPGRTRVVVAFVTPSSPDRLHEAAQTLRDVRVATAAQELALLVTL